MIDDVHQQLPIFVGEIDQPNVPDSVYHENEILYLSWYISEHFYGIWLTEVSEWKFINKRS